MARSSERPAARKAKPPFPTAAAFLPASLDLASLHAAAQHCEGCPLFADATQAVFGEGAESAEVVLIGETPGNEEDLSGRPFVGPAGRLLDQALEEVGIPRERTYVTNAVKHFKWTPQGKRRLHAKPSAREIKACRPWLEAELETLHPAMIVCLGATAAQALFGSKFRLTRERGQALPSPYCDWTFATYHPSAVLRARQADYDGQIEADFMADLRTIAKYYKKLHKGRR